MSGKTLLRVLLRPHAELLVPRPDAREVTTPQNVHLDPDGVTLSHIPHDSNLTSLY